MNNKLLKDYITIMIYTVLAMGIGIIVGAIDALFGRVLLEITGIREENPMKFIPFLAVAGVFIVWIYETYSRESLKGMTLVFHVGHGKNNKIPKMLVPLIILCTWITHLFGGSAGREGVAVQLGATVSHTISRYLKIVKNPKVFLVIGMAAGFAGLFQTPLAATFFAMEVLTAGAMAYGALFPALVAAYVASETSSYLGLEKFYVNIPFSMELSAATFAKLILIGLLFGIAGGGFAYLLEKTKKYVGGKVVDPKVKIFVIGIILSVIFLLLHLGRYSGLGTNIISLSFSGGKIYAYDWILKLLLTIITLAAGFQGGEVTPLFSIGASLGIVLASILGLPAELVAALGYAAVFGSATNTLLAPIFIGLEVFGSANITYFVIVCAVAYIFNGNKTIYAAQNKFDIIENS